MIRVENVELATDYQKPLSDISTVFRDGEITGIIGPSGSGKTTFLETLNLLNMPSTGKIYLNEMEITAPGVDVDKVRQRMGMVFVRPVLFRYMNVIENVMIGMVDLKGMDKDDAKQKAMRLLEMTGIADKALVYPEEISTGKQQCAAIARAFSLDPEVLLLDEPMANIDPIMKGSMEKILKEYAKAGHTVVMVTHEKALLETLCDRIIYMDDGRIIEEGPKEKMINCPEHAEVKEFLELLLTS